MQIAARRARPFSASAVRAMADGPMPPKREEEKTGVAATTQ